MARDRTKELEKLIKDKLVEEGINPEWIDSHVIVDNTSDETPKRKSKG